MGLGWVIKQRVPQVVGKHRGGDRAANILAPESLTITTTIITIITIITTTTTTTILSFQLPSLHLHRDHQQRNFQDSVVLDIPKSLNQMSMIHPVPKTLTSIYKYRWRLRGKYRPLLQRLLTRFNLKDSLLYARH